MLQALSQVPDTYQSPPFLLVVAAIAALFAFGTSAFGRTWYIKAGGGGDVPTIRAGIDSATVGDVVLVARGVYSSTVQVQADGQPTIVNAYVTEDMSLQSEKSSSLTKIDASDSAISALIVGVISSAEVASFEISIASQSKWCLLTRGAARAVVQARYAAAIRCDASNRVTQDNTIHDVNIGIARVRYYVRAPS